MRIIAGKYKGRKLVNFKAKQIRPTTDRVKETIFNLLMFHIEEARVLDLFSGTGNLGIEALSRGAQHVDCVEKSSSSLKVIKENLKTLKIDDEISLIGSDVLSYIKTFKGQAYDIVFVDPPFTQKMAHDVMECISESLIFDEQTKIVIESSRHERMDESYMKLKRTHFKSFGDKFLSIFSI